MTSLPSAGHDRVSARITACRACGAAELVPVLDLGDSPLADRLLTAEQLGVPEITVPLEFVFCPSCTLVQITETVAPEVLFCQDYPYYSSVSKSLLAHFAASAESIIESRGLGADSLVVEAASNDGYMLRSFAQAGIPVLGVDPADGPARVASESGIETLNTFFTLALARELREQGRRADAFLANNVLAHVADLGGFVDGVATILADDGVAVIEVPYLLDLVDHCEFDTIYHQHLCYFSVMALDRLFRAHSLYLNDVHRTAIHGGSLRLFVGKREDANASVGELLAMETERGMDQRAYYEDFSNRVRSLCNRVTETLRDLKAAGHRIMGYGAAAKACTLMHACGMGSDVLDSIADLSPVKQGKYMTGNHLPIVAPHRIVQDAPDYVMILAWNFADEIMRQLSAHERAGGKFIVPIPELRII